MTRLLRSAHTGWIRLAALAVLASSLGALGCGGEAVVPAADDDGLSDPHMCELPAAGEDFTFTIRNTGERSLSLNYGCGTDFPFAVETPDGVRGIGAGNANSCEIPCERVYEGHDSWGCSDCGPGYGELLPPGGTIAIVWDRRVYVDFEVPAACTTAELRECALGTRIAAETYAASLTFCHDEYDNQGGYCYGEEETVPFTLDMAADGVTIDVQ